MLARAFLPPQPAAVANALRTQLADELEETAPLHDDVAALRRSLQDVPDDLALLQLYSRLFLAPPRLVHLNAGLYLDRTLMGPSTLAIERSLAANGYARSEAFRELPDHVSAQLEFLAVLHAGGQSEEAENFARAFVRPWLPALAQRLQAVCAEHGLPRPYAHLAALAAAVLWKGEAPAPQAGKPTKVRNVRPLPSVACGDCGRDFEPAREVRAMKHLLRKRGKPSSYLDLCPECRQI